MTQKIIDTEIEKKIYEYEEYCKTHSEKEIDWFHNDAEHEIRIQTKLIYYNSIFISLYSFLERKMLVLARIAEENQKLKLADLSWAGIFKCYNYFSKVLSIEMKDLNKYWVLINDYNELRNQIVHNPICQLEKTQGNKTKIEKLKKIDGLKIIEIDNYIKFEIDSEKILTKFCDVINFFLHDIYYENVTN